MTMTDSQVRAIVLQTLLRIAPEVETAGLVPSKPLRDQVDLDSMDWLNFLIGLNDQLKVEIPESDYAKLVSLNDLVNYLQIRL